MEPRYPWALPGAQAEALWDPLLLEGFVNSIAGFGREQRSVVIKKLASLLKGEERAWQSQRVEPRAHLQRWQCAVQSTQLSRDAHLVWWVELSAAGQQILIIAKLVRGVQLAAARERAAAYLRTYSDDYLDACMRRTLEGSVVKPTACQLIFGIRREEGGQEILEAEADAGGREVPLSLEKRYQASTRLLNFLAKHSLRGVQLPYQLDEDEERALAKVFREPVFLLGRSGSGKTSVLVRALYVLSDEPQDGQLLEVEEEDGPVVMLVTRSPVLTASIRKLYMQMLAGLEREGEEDEAGERGAEMGGIELGVAC